jgi:hypothetical protein
LVEAVDLRQSVVRLVALAVSGQQSAELLLAVLVDEKAHDAVRLPVEEADAAVVADAGRREAADREGPVAVDCGLEGRLHVRHRLRLAVDSDPLFEPGRERAERPADRATHDDMAELVAEDVRG